MVARRKISRQQQSARQSQAARRRLAGSGVLSAQSQKLWRRRPYALRPTSAFIARDGGFTSVGVVVALLVALALVFTAAQVRWTQSRSADIQFVADSAALAGENVVAEYIVIARAADAVVLSMSLFGITVFGIAIVVSCIPYCQTAGERLADFGRKVLDARDDCARNAASGLDKLQKALPFLCAVNAAAAVGANKISRDGSERYFGVAVPLPLQGEAQSYPSSELVHEKTGEVAGHNEKTAELSSEAQQAKDDMDENKLAGYLADCGSSPQSCMYERASRLAGLGGNQNPFFSSVDLWLFDYAYDRASAYYSARLANERPASSALDEQVRSYARSRFYNYAVAQMSQGYARTSADGTLSAYFPLLPRNSAETRATELYTEAAYPYGPDGCLHGVPTCPAIECTGSNGMASLADLEAGLYTVCEDCNLTVAVLGRVANASTNIENGFEYHYRKVAEAAERYMNAQRRYSEKTGEAKDSANQALDAFSMALDALKTPRIKPHPPGRSGCIAIVVDASTRAMPEPFVSSLAGGDARIAPRVAISAAAMAEDKATDDGSILASFFDKAKADAEGGATGAGLGVFSGVMQVWGSALLAYSRGSDGLASGLVDYLRSIPLVRSTPLAGWAENALRETIEALGLEGASLGTPKPVLVNTLHVARACQNPATDGLASLKQGYSALPGSGSGSMADAALDGLLGLAEAQGAAALESDFTVFSIRFSDMPGTPEIPITIRLPQGVVDAGRERLSSLRSSLQSSLQGSMRAGGGTGAWQ